MYNLVFDDKNRVGAWVAEQVEQTASWGDFYAMGLERDGELVSGMVFNNFNGVNATCHIAVTKMSKGLVELMDHAYRYAFIHAGLSRLTGLVDSDNHKALKIDKNMGFVEEGVLERAGAEGQDVIVLVMWPENYKRRNKVNELAPF